MDDTNAGRTQGENQLASGGVDPTRPVGPGNPPAAHTWRAGHSGNPDGMKKGQRHMKLILKDIFDSEHALDEKKRANAAKFLGKDHVDDLTAREIMLLAQVDRAFKGNTQAFMALAKIAGEYSDAIEGLGEALGQVILLKAGYDRVNLDDFKDNPEAMEALLAQQAEEEAERKDAAEAGAQTSQ